MQNVELRRPARATASLPGNAGADRRRCEVVAVAQVVDESDQRVRAVLRHLPVVRYGAFVEHPADGGDPFLDDPLEVAIDYVGGRAARTLAFRSSAIVGTKQRRERLLDRAELGTNRREFLRRRLYRYVARSPQLRLGRPRGRCVGLMRSGLPMPPARLAFLRGSLALMRGSPAFIRSSSALVGYNTPRRAAAIRVLFHADTDRSTYNIAKIRLLGAQRAFCKPQKRRPAIRPVAKGLGNIPIR